MDGFQHTQWLLWLAAALGAGLVEIVTVDFFFLMVAGGALLTAVAAGFGLPLPLQAIFFAATSGSLLYGVRPPLKRWGRTEDSTDETKDYHVFRLGVRLVF